MEPRSSTPVVAFATDNFEPTPPPEALRHKHRRSRRSQYNTYNTGVRGHRRSHSPSAFKVEQEKGAREHRRRTHSPSAFKSEEERGAREHRHRHRHDSGAEPRRVRREGLEHRRSRDAKAEPPPMESPAEGNADHVIDVDDGASHEKETGSSIAPIEKSGLPEQDGGPAQHNATHTHRRKRRRRREYPDETERPRREYPDRTERPRRREYTDGTERPIRREYPDETQRPRYEGGRRHRHHRDREGGEGKRRRDVDRDSRSTRDYHESSGSAEGRKRPPVDGERKRHRRRRVPSRERPGDRRSKRGDEGGFLSKIIGGFRKLFSN